MMQYVRRAKYAVSFIVPWVWMSVYFRAFFNKRNSSVYTRWSTSWASDVISISLCGLARVRANRYPCLKCGLGIRETSRYAAAEEDKSQVSNVNHIIISSTGSFSRNVYQKYILPVLKAVNWCIFGLSIISQLVMKTPIPHCSGNAQKQLHK
jgi:hypothetical protein